MFSEIICSSDSIDNATDTCTAKVGETCDTLTCNYGYHRNPDVGSLNCTESGDWNYNHSSICLGWLFVIRIFSLRLLYLRHVLTSVRASYVSMLFKFLLYSQ